MRKVILLSAAICLNAEVFELGQIEVISSPIDKKSVASVEVIDSFDIKRDEIKRLSDVAKKVPGVYAEKKGGRGEQNINIRGFNSKRVPLFIDGIPVYVPYDGNIDMSRFTTFDLEEIHISKGFSSMLYGPNTMGGAINLITKRPTKEFEGSVGYGLKFGGDSGTFGNDIYFNLGTNQGLCYVQVGGSYAYSQGQQLSGSYAQSPYSDEDGKDLDRSGKKDSKLSFKFGLTPNETDEYVIGYTNQQADKEQPFYAGKDPNANKKYWDWPEYDKESIYFLSHTEFDNSFYVKSKLFYDTFDSLVNMYKDKPLSKIDSFDDFKDYSYGGGVEIGGKTSDTNTLKFAFNYKFDQHKERTLIKGTDIVEPWQKMEDHTYSFALEDIYEITNKTKILAGISYDIRDASYAQDYVQVGTTGGGGGGGGRPAAPAQYEMYQFDTGKKEAFNYQLALKHSFDDKDELTLSFAKKTAFPGMKDRYPAKRSKNIANPYLDAETAYHYEIAYVRNILDSLRVESALFYSDVKDAITSVRLPNNEWQKQNVDDESIKGFELGLSWFVNDRLELGGNYTYLSTDYSDGVDILKLPKHKGFIYADIALSDKLSLYISEYMASSRKSNLGIKAIQTAGYSVTDIKFTYEPKKDLLIDVGIANLFDKNYEYDEGFFEEGRVFFSNISYKF